jgi:REP element-mobilizing transposase RayT
LSRPKRLAGFRYIGPNRYFLTFCTRSRHQAFVDDLTVGDTLVQFRRTAAENGFAIVAYCMMPDHAHLLVEGTTTSADLRRFAKLAKQRSGAAYAMRVGRALWQEGYYDRVMRHDEDTKAFARYILENPVRASLATHASTYPYSGSDIWSMEELEQSM